MLPFNEEIERANRKKFEELLNLKSMKGEGVTKPETPGATATVTDTDFTRQVQSHHMMVVDFWAPWCAPCRVVSPVLEELASKYSGKVTFGKMNVDENPMTAAAFGIESIPTIMIFREGKPVDGIVGAVPKDQIEGKIRSHLDGGSFRMSPYR